MGALMYDSPVKTFWTEVNGETFVALRRYVSAGTDVPPCPSGQYHQAQVPLGNRPGVDIDVEELPHDDVRWPTHCEATGCRYAFKPGDAWQMWTERVYVCPATGETWPMRSLPPGAMYDAYWRHGYHALQTPPDDGICLAVICPSGADWVVDSQASNCGRPSEPHSCWVRHGDPKAANVTVDKVGNTCAAGAGSIIAGDYHGFLRGGYFTAGI